MARIVVGVDGSEDSLAALRWAVEEAAARGDDVLAVYVYGPSEEHNPFFAAHSGYASSTTTSQMAQNARRWQDEAKEEGQRHAAGVLERIVRDATDDIDGVEVDRVAESGGRPVRALLKHANKADVIAVGARGRGGFRGLRLGSTSEKIVRHAPCSVMVRRAD